MRVQYSYTTVDLLQVQFYFKHYIRLKRPPQSNPTSPTSGLEAFISVTSKMSNSENKSKADIIEERRANLPLPEDPPVAPDWQSADARKVNVGSGGVQSDISTGGGSDSLRGPATSDSSVRTDGEAMGVNTSDPNEGMGRQGVDGTEDIPKDAKAS
ncbi:hypothetical protein MMC18_004285 [Xylographa bjoerkii]|nr:hypothetical protein [Xylographa bjoerkii]